MKIKNPKSRKKYSNIPIEGGTWDEYFDQELWDKQPLCDETIARWAKQIRDWVKNDPDPRYISQFYNSINVSDLEFDRLCEKYDRLMAAKKFAQRIIGENIYRRSVDQKANWQAVKYSLYRHAPEFKKDSDHEVAVKQAIEPDKEVILQLQYVKDTGVPFRKIE